MKQKNGLAMSFYAMGTAGLFLTGFLLLVLFGAQAYRVTVNSQERNDQARALLSYISACVGNSDAEGAVAILNENGGPVLVITEGASGYALRIYQHNGFLMEDYGRADSGLDPASAQVIGETDLFRAEEIAEHTFAITTDAGRVLVHLRSEGGGA